MPSTSRVSGQKVEKVLPRRCLNPSHTTAFLVEAVEHGSKRTRARRNQEKKKRMQKHLSGCSGKYALHSLFHACSTSSLVVVPVWIEVTTSSQRECQLGNHVGLLVTCRCWSPFDLWLLYLWSRNACMEQSKTYSDKQSFSEFSEIALNDMRRILGQGI